LEFVAPSRDVLVPPFSLRALLPYWEQP